MFRNYLYVAYLGQKERCHFLHRCYSDVNYRVKNRSFPVFHPERGRTKRIVITMRSGGSDHWKWQLKLLKIPNIFHSKYWKRWIFSTHVPNILKTSIKSYWKSWKHFTQIFSFGKTCNWHFLVAWIWVYESCMILYLYVVFKFDPRNQ